MAKADLTLPDGTTVAIEGNADEVAVLLERIGRSRNIPARQTSSPKGKARTRSQPSPRRRTNKGAVDHVRELVVDDFFRDKRALGEVRAILEQRAHIYPVTSLSPVMFRLVKSKELRRIREDGQWKYVNP